MGSKVRPACGRYGQTTGEKYSHTSWWEVRLNQLVRGTVRPAGCRYGQTSWYEKRSNKLVRSTFTPAVVQSFYSTGEAPSMFQTIHYVFMYVLYGI